MAQRLERLIGMAEIINKGRYPTVTQLCEKFEIQERTVFEDIRCMREQMGMEIKFDRFHGGYTNANPKKQLPEFDLTTGEVFALTLGNEMLGGYAGTSFEPVLRSAIEKIQKRLPERVKVPLDEIRSLVKFNPGPVVHASMSMFFDLNKACEKTLPVELTYHSARKDETTERTVHAYKLLQNGGAWYLVGYCCLRRDLRIFALNRIQRYHLCDDQRFSPREDLDIDGWIESAFQLEHGHDGPHRIKVRFQPLAARYIRERKWHPSQVLTDCEDGSCMLEFDTLSLDEAKRWVLTYGSEAEVLEPGQLRDLVCKEITASIAQYNGHQQ